MNDKMKIKCHNKVRQRHDAESTYPAGFPGLVSLNALIAGFECSNTIFQGCFRHNLTIPYYMYMNIALTPGQYVVAVSGGVDSMVLLDLLRRRPDLKLTVAHFDHGIREESAEDRRLVESVARQHGLPFVYAEGHLGAGTSEAAAREARYEFLRRVKRAVKAKGIITAHHQDDLLETAMLNMMRGTGRRGLSPMGTIEDIHRPFLQVPKHKLIKHARDNQLVWYEDATNKDQNYRQNYVRHQLLPRLQPEHREQLLELAKRQA